MDIDKDIMARVIAEMIVADIMATRPTTTTEIPTLAEKPMAWIEVYDDAIDEAYDMSKEYRKYD
tara:strand:- start:196 stop:387 length:192 start_codon:yes stop_codon:yes gene_type:complete